MPGTPTLAEACGDWFREILCAFLASEDPETKQRLVWELLCMVPKKNSKTTYVAALGLTALFMEDAPNRQMLIVAPSQNISERCFDQAQGMIRLDERLKSIFKVQDHLKCITRRKTGTKLDVKSFDTSIVTGEIPILTIIDEVHELGKKAKAAAVMQQIRGGGITKQGGQVLMITTQSDEAPAGIWKTELIKARKIRDGEGGSNPDPAADPLRISRAVSERPVVLAGPAQLAHALAEHRPVDRRRATGRRTTRTTAARQRRPNRSGRVSISTSRSASASVMMGGRARTTGSCEPTRR